MGATVVEGEPQGGGTSQMSRIGCQTEIMIQSLLDKVQGPKKDKFLLGMKVWLQYQPKMGQQLPQLTGSVPSTEEVKEAAAFPPLMDDGWMSFMFSMIRRMVAEESARSEHWVTVLQFKEQALIEEAKAKLNLLSCQRRCGQEAGSGPPAESFNVAFQLMHQQAQMKRLVQATQAAAEDRTLILKHLADIETHRALTVELQKQAEAFQKEAQRPSPQGSSQVGTPHPESRTPDRDRQCGQDQLHGLTSHVDAVGVEIHKLEEMLRLQQMKLDVAKQGNQDMFSESSDNEGLDQAIKVLPDAQVEKVMLCPEMPVTLKVIPAQDPCMDVANQRNQDLVEKSSETLKNPVECVSESPPGMSISPSGMFYYTSEDSDSEESLSDTQKGKCVSTECPRNDTQSFKGEVASSHATALLCAQEDSETHYEEDFEVLSDEMELECSGKACWSSGSDDDSAESLLTDSAESDGEEMPEDIPQCEKEAPSVSTHSNEQASDTQAGTSKLRVQEASAQSTKAGQEDTEAAAATPTRQLQVEAKDTLHHPAEVEMLVHHAVQEMWEVFDLGQGPKDLSGISCPRPSEDYLKMVHPGQAHSITDRHSYNKLIFHLCWETLEDLCAKDPTTQPIWKKNQPERHNYVEKLKSFNDFSKVKEYITEEVLKLCGLTEEKDAAMYGRVFAYNYQGFNLTKFDQILLREIPEEEHKWLDQDKEAFDVKNKYAKAVFDHLLDDTLKCLLGLAKKATKKS